MAHRPSAAQPALAYTTGQGLSVLDDHVVTLVESSAMRVIAAGT
jgi:hypothetical protein